MAEPPLLLGRRIAFQLEVAPVVEVGLKIQGEKQFFALQIGQGSEIIIQLELSEY